MDSLGVILLAGGQGTRFSTQQNKLLTLLRGQPVFVHSLQCFLNISRLACLVIVCPDLPDYQKIIFQFSTQSVCPILRAEPGISRRESVWHGLRRLPKDIQTVLIHDAARPLVTLASVEQLSNHYQSPGVSLGIPVSDTLKQVDRERLVTGTVNRESLWMVQTPQLFNRQILSKAHARVDSLQAVTDDFQLLEYAGFGPLRIVAGSKHNLKITTYEDLMLAEAILSLNHSIIK